MRRFVDRSDSGGNRPLLNSGESIRYELMDVEIAFTPSTVIGNGSLFVTSSRVIWIGIEQAFDFDVQYIILHAITHDLNSYPKPCLYCQFDSEEKNEESENENDDEEEENHSKRPHILDDPTEMYLVPKNPNDLQSMFDAFSTAAMENPDDLEEFDGNLIYNLDEIQLGSEQARTLAHLESIFVLSDDSDEKD